MPNAQLRFARESKGWSQRYLAEKLDTHAFTVARWELGITFPSPHYRQKLCEVFACSVEELGLLPEHKEKTHDGTDEAINALVEKGNDVYPSFVPIGGPERFIGRALLLHDLQQDFCDESHNPIAALYGLPGVGKTTTIAAFAREPTIRQRFPHGILWASLGQTPNVFAVLSTWALHLGLSSQDLAQIKDSAALSSTVGSLIHGRHFLLVIDDAWNIVDALAFKVGAASCGHMLTTRFPVIAEQFAPRHAIRLPELSEDDSSELLHYLAPVAVTQEPEAARLLAQAAGGLPLALTLLGNYLNMQSIGGQPRRIRAALAYLKLRNNRMHITLPLAPSERPPSLDPATPLSLQTIIAASVEQLAEDAQIILRAMAILPAKPNSLAEAAAYSICGLSQERFFVGLNGLFDAGLIESAGLERYMVHQTIADYIRLDAPSHEMAQRLVRYFVDLVEQFSPAYAALTDDVMNLSKALEIAYEYRMSRELVQGCLASAPFFVDRCLIDLLAPHLARAVAEICDQNTNEAFPALMYYQATIAEYNGFFAQGQADALTGLTHARQFQQRELSCQLLALLANIAISLGQHEHAFAYLEEGMTLARQTRSYAQLCTLRYTHGMLLYRLGMIAQARVAFVKGLHLARFLHADDHIAACLSGLGHIVRWQGDERGGEALYQESLEIYQRLGLRDRSIAVMLNLSVAAQNQGDSVRAEAYCQEALATARIIGHRVRMASALMNLGQQASMRGAVSQAESYHRESLTISRDMQHRPLMSYALTNLGAVLLYQGKFAEAESYLQEGLALSRELQSYESQCFALESLGRLALEQHDYAQAETYAQECGAIAQEKGLKDRLGTSLYVTGQIMIERGNFGEAGEALAQALDIAQAAEFQWLSCDVMNGWGKCYLKQQQLAEAEKAFSQAEEISSSIKSQIRRAIALYGLAQVARMREEWGMSRRIGQESLALIEQSGQYLQHEIKAWLATLPAE